MWSPSIVCSIFRLSKKPHHWRWRVFVYKKHDFDFIIEWFFNFGTNRSQTGTAPSEIVWHRGVKIWNFHHKTAPLKFQYRYRYRKNGLTASGFTENWRGADPWLNPFAAVIEVFIVRYDLVLSEKVHTKKQSVERLTAFFWNEHQSEIGIRLGFSWLLRLKPKNLEHCCSYKRFLQY